MTYFVFLKELFWKQATGFHHPQVNARKANPFPTNVAGSRWLRVSRKVPANPELLLRAARGGKSFPGLEDLQRIKQVESEFRDGAELIGTLPPNCRPIRTQPQEFVSEDRPPRCSP